LILYWIDLVLALLLFSMQPELLTAVKAQDRGAFKQMYEAYIRYVYSIVSRYHSDSSNYQDIIQEIFAIVFLKIDTYDPAKGEFKGWLRAVTVNQCLKHYHASKKHIATVSLDSIEKYQQPVELSHSELSREDLLDMLASMPSGYKEVFMLITVDGFSHKEASEMLNISTETSRSQLHRAKLWLKEHLDRNKSNALSYALHTR
jgi:RNA polymerase sigma factor (sigma-70 family)